jgi:hypothetical protein
MAGKKTFVAGEVLLAQDVNDYLMDQTVMTFVSDAARASAIPTPTEGMFAVTTDNDEIDYYNGSAWVPALPVGAWTNYTFAISAGGGALGSTSINRARFTQIGKTAHVFFDFNVVANGTGTTNITVGLPFTPANSLTTGYGRESSATGKMLVLFTSGANAIITNYDATYPAGSGYRLSCAITFEVA